MRKIFAVYILTNKNNNVLYIGVTDNLYRRVQEHKSKKFEGFTKKYNVNKLVYFEVTENVDSALNREKQLKNWHRERKFELIKRTNPTMKDLYYDLY